MKYAAILPPHGLRVLERVGLGYHLVLAQELMRSEEYRKYYRALGRLGHFIIIDNGAAERDTPPFSKVVQLAAYVQASEIVMPDTVLDWEATVGNFTDEALALVPSRKRMIVPQGSNIEEWFLCLDAMLDKCKFSIESIGLSKYHEGVFLGGRAAVLARLLDEYGPLLEHIHIHILGIATGDPYAEVAALHAVFPGIRGVDTAAPVAWAQRLRPLPDPAAAGEHISIAWNEPFDLELARKNVMAFALHTAELKSNA